MIIFDTFYKAIKIDEYMILSLDCNTGSNIIDNRLKVIILLGKFIWSKIKLK